LYKVDKNLQKKVADNKIIDFLATIDDDNTPHITVLSSIMFHDPETVIWGQYTHGMSKKNLKVRPQNAFMVLTDQNEIIRGSSVWKDAKKTGPEYDMINDIPYFRYNAYCSLAYVHYMDLLGIDLVSRIDFAEVNVSRERTFKAAKKLTPGSLPEAMKYLTVNLFSQPDSIKVLSFIADDGRPRIIPICQSVPASQGNRILFSTDIYTDELKEIPEGACVAIYGISQSGVRYSVMLKGIFSKKNVNGTELGIVDVDRVYNPMLPAVGYIYPQQPLIAIREFKDSIDV
jgi:hypothetical protein